jgi:iron complex outermembrane receptor protein
MKKFFLITLLLSFALAAYSQLTTDTLKNKTPLTEVVVHDVNVKKTQPVTFTVLSKKELQSQNFGQDIPILLNLTPSAVVNSDAGAGVGYTGIRIRGTDATRTNVTVNGVPISDAESHGTFWVNMPDLVSSTQSIQVQRGVGSSVNGAAAFGASINVQTDGIQQNPYAELAQSYGSFNTWKHTIKAGTGLLQNKWMVDARLSKISSNGFIDRGTSDLKSFFVSGSRYGEKSILKLVVFSGKEITYQAWNGIPEARLKGDVNGMLDYALNNNLSEQQTRELLQSASRTYNPFRYQNQTDNYQQDHYQLFYTYRIHQRLLLNVGLHYTYGRGYYEEYRNNELFTTYKLADSLVLFDQYVKDVQNKDSAIYRTVKSGDFIRRRWLDNDFYGTVFSLSYQLNKFSLVWGGALNRYDGRHFGELIWAQYSQGSNINNRFYEGKSTKTDASSYLKAEYKIGNNISAFADFQVRSISYRLNGTDLNSLSGKYIPYDFNLNYFFFNPKAGITFHMSNKSNVYFFFGVGGKEPVRSDIIQSGKNSLPQSERLYNYELGYRSSWKKFELEANAYYMDYVNQLVNTGQINDVGAYNRVNVSKSYRAGIELSAIAFILRKLRWQTTFTYSDNRIQSYQLYTDDYDNGGQVIETLSNKKIAFSPDIIASSLLSYTFLQNAEVSFISKYVGSQYLDNTQNNSRMLQAFWVNDVRINYTFAIKKLFQSVRLGLLINNVFNASYEPNGYTYGWIYGGKRNDFNMYYPQAGTNWLASVSLAF